MTLFITGGSGLVGRRLSVTALEAGHRVVVLTRNAASARRSLPRAVELVEGDGTRAGSWQERAAVCEAVVNLAGENLFARRWTPEFKRTLVTSRIESTGRVVEAVCRAERRTRVLVSASAVGYYGSSTNVEFTENAPPGEDFLARLCLDWETAAQKAADACVRVVPIRIGVVLDPAGGALKQMLVPFRLFLGGPAGTGRQWLSWIHIDDLVGIILLAVNDDALSGPINATAPYPVTNGEFARALGRAVSRPSFLPAPAAAMRLALGEVASLILDGQRVLPSRAQAAGYRFRHPQLDEALDHLFARKHRSPIHVAAPGRSEAGSA